MPNLKKASYQLFARPEDERFPDFDSLYEHCASAQKESQVHWKAPTQVIPVAMHGNLGLKLTGDSAYTLNDWSFGQACSIASINKETVNRLKTETAVQVLLETMPVGEKPIQVLTKAGQVRSIHGASYTRLYDCDVLNIVMDEASDFTPPPVGFNGATGLYAGEQDMFAFMVDNDSWVDIDGEQFAPGFFIWNSEVGRRTVGIETFWFQRICGNHIVWEATEVVSYKRKHTANVADALGEMRMILRQLVDKRDQRKDAFAYAIKQSMNTSLGSTPEDATKALTGFGIGVGHIKAAVASMSTHSGGFTVFGAVDALTRISRQIVYAGDRAAYDSKIGTILSLAS
ncbi:DUF932 domain-containing protein [Gimesia maris]|uniref:DUF932 domain-containing protein n=1 Tax=Gimesia maris TaxID=122 RepID=UPI003A943F7E